MNIEAVLPKPAPVTTFGLAHGEFHGLRVDAPEIFALSGAFRTGAAALRGESVLGRLTAALAASGGGRHGGFEIAELLEARGARLSIESGAGEVRFSVRACVADFREVVGLLMACLREPAFEQARVEAERARLMAELQYRAVDPGASSSDALTRLLYPPGHPLHVDEVPAQIAQLQACTATDVRGYHRAHYGANDLRIAVVGDLDPEAAARVIEAETAAWPPSAVDAAMPEAPRQEAPTTTRVPLPGQESFGVALGQRLRLEPAHPDYLALQLANRILGGSFASRLVGEVRERCGLSYLIRSELVAPRRGSGHWQVGLSASPGKLDAALEATRAVVADFVAGGAEGEEFEAARRAAIGAFQIGLATLDGLSEAILSAAARGWPRDALLAFEPRAMAVTHAQLNRVLSEHLQPQAWRTAIAGPL
ncbi:M16 family metallopeptidase [Luteimonas aquatica]|uniref:M16 family metallopeptidase n=1 Tax=Luteimonas aquatica TaxID=450364 RepID=UPI001F58475B|nr:pitrilysin family protein [Luteimonas aquatica]